jgi:hypothetical protein
MGHGVTNVAHNDDLQTILRRLMGLWYMRYNESSYSFDDHHVPDISTPEGLHDLMALGNLMELGRVVDRRTYTSKGIDRKEGAEIIAARRWYRIIQIIVARKFQFYVGGKLMNVASVFKRSLLEFAAGIITYKRQLDATQDGFFSLPAVMKEMKNFVRHNYPELMACYDQLVTIRHKHLAWSAEAITIKPRANLDSRKEHFNFEDLDLYELPAESAVLSHLDTIPEDMEVDELAGDDIVHESKATAKPRSRGVPVRASKRIQLRASSVGEFKECKLRRDVLPILYTQSHQVCRHRKHRVHRNRSPEPRAKERARLSKVSMSIMQHC